MRRKIIGIFICTLLIVLTTNSVIAYTNSKKSSYYNISLGECYLRIDADPLPFVLPKYAGNPIGFDVDITNIDTNNDCTYYEATLAIYEGWLIPDFLEQLDPTYIFNDSEDPLEYHEIHDLTGIWPWTPEYAGLYNVEARVTDENGYYYSHSQAFIVSKSRNIERSQSSQQSANSLLISLLEQFPILRLLFQR